MRTHRRKRPPVDDRLPAFRFSVASLAFAPANLADVVLIHGSVTSRGRLSERYHEHQGNSALNVFSDGRRLASWHLFYERPCLGCASSSSMSDKAFGRAEADGGRGNPTRSKEDTRDEDEACESALPPFRSDSFAWRVSDVFLEGGIRHPDRRSRKRVLGHTSFRSFPMHRTRAVIAPHRRRTGKTERKTDAPPRKRSKAMDRPL
mmetsp:Transcript_10510/g.64386  ORF Transcript_10510/g.64386 Transcript_10510/m.64386 type:complete len:205 (+) Transcript_10510:120-734(+)